MRRVCERLASSGCEPTRRRDQPVPAPARRQPRRLVPVGRRGAGARPRRGQADPALDRLRRLPLVPRDGARVVRERRDRGVDERALRQRQGRPRGAARPRRGLHGGGRRAVRAGRLADDGLPDARRRAVLRRHVLPARAAARPAELPAGAGRDRGGLARPARRRRAVGGAARRGGRPLGVAPPVQRAADRRVARRGGARPRARASSPRTAAGGARRSSRTRPCSSSCSGATATTPAPW